MSHTWILVADQVRARLFTLDADAKDLIEVGDYVNAEARIPAHELAHARRPPRVHERFGAVRHSIEPRTAPQDKYAARFASLLESVLDRDFTTDQHRKLVLIAPPRFLGTLNATLGTRLQESVVLRVPKNLTRRNNRTILAEIPRSLLRRSRITVA